MDLVIAFLGPRIKDDMDNLIEFTDDELKAASTQELIPALQAEITRLKQRNLILRAMVNRYMPDEEVNTDKSPETPNADPANEN